MRHFAALYNSETKTWSVIFKDWNEEEWYVEASNVGSKENAEMLANSKNTLARMMNADV